MTNFEQSFAYLFKDEGGFVNNPSDPGGATKYGITRLVLSRARSAPVSDNDVKALTISEAKAIYKKYYWDPMSLDDIKDGRVACCIFNIDVVVGYGAAAKTAQRVCRMQDPEFKVDGIFGGGTILAINEIKPEKFITAFAKLAGMEFRVIADKNPKEKVFLAGWENRAQRLLTLLKRPA